MERYSEAFVEFLIETKALRFGDYTLKSGRKSPYFFNSGLFNTGELLLRLGYFYSCAILDLEERPTTLFGPAYKGIPLCVATAIAMTQRLGMEVSYCFDRKEAKEHGEGGNLIGHEPQGTDTICIIDDVITSGATKIDAIEQLRSQTSAQVTSLIIALNRCEEDEDGRNPVVRLSNQAGVEVRSIATIHDVLRYVEEEGRQSTVDVIKKYLDEYGVQ